MILQFDVKEKEKEKDNVVEAEVDKNKDKDSHKLNIEYISPVFVKLFDYLFLQSIKNKVTNCYIFPLINI